MSGIEISGKGFLYDAVAQVPFFREGEIPDENIVQFLARLRSIYQGTGAHVEDGAYQAVLDIFDLPGAKPKDAPLT